MENFPRIKVMNYREALEYVYLHSGIPNEAKYAIISIQEPTHGYGFGLEFKKGGNCLHALNIEFSDCTPAIFVDGQTLMTIENAWKIHDFVESLSKDVQLLIIHCTGGTCRSAAVAAALLFVKTGSNKAIFSDTHYVPNMYVYYNILETYNIPNRYWEECYNTEKKLMETTIAPPNIPSDEKLLMLH